MKKKIIKASLLASLLLVLFIIAFAVVNFLDAPKPEGAYTLLDLPPASLEPGNGYYLYLALTYPAGENANSPKIVMDFKKMSEPGILKGGSKELMKMAARHCEIKSPLPGTAAADLNRYAARRKRSSYCSRSMKFCWAGTRACCMLKPSRIFPSPLQSIPLPTIIPL
jgi:hypothetical protein